MLFNSIAFLVFFPVTLTIYYLLPKNRWRTWFLLLSSYYFYMNQNPRCALILLGSTLVTYVGGLALEAFSKQKQRRRVLLAIVCANVLVLTIFKYANFLTDSIIAFMNAMGGGFLVINLILFYPLALVFTPSKQLVIYRMFIMEE